MIVRDLRRVLLPLALLAAGACSFLAPQPDSSRFYVLTSTVDVGPAPVDDTAAGLALGIGPIELPDYLDRSQLVTRVGANQVEFSDLARWAEPLERNFGRVLGENLSRLLNTERIVSLPSFVPGALRYEVPVEVLRFEGDAGGQVELAARWAVRDSADGKLLHSRESRVTETATESTTEGVVDALSRAVGTLSEEIAAEIRRLAAAS